MYQRRRAVHASETDDTDDMGIEGRPCLRGDQDQVTKENEAATAPATTGKPPWYCGRRIEGRK